MGVKLMRALSRLESSPWLHLSQTTPGGSTSGGLPPRPWLPRLSGMTCSTLVNGPSDCLQYRQIGKASSHAIEPALHPEDTLKPGINKALPTPPESGTDVRLGPTEPDVPYPAYAVLDLGPLS